MTLKILAVYVVFISFKLYQLTSKFSSNSPLLLKYTSNIQKLTSTLKCKSRVAIFLKCLSNLEFFSVFPFNPSGKLKLNFESSCFQKHSSRDNPLTDTDSQELYQNKMEKIRVHDCFPTTDFKRIMVDDLQIKVLKNNHSLAFSHWEPKGESCPRFYKNIFINATE